jgi:hypothetical protein
MRCPSLRCRDSATFPKRSGGPARFAGDFGAHPRCGGRTPHRGVRRVRFRVDEEFLEASTQPDELGSPEVRQQFALELRSGRQRAREQLLARSAKRDSQDAPMLRRFTAFDQPAPLERADEVHDRLRADARGTREIRARYIGGLLEPEQHQELRGRQPEGHEKGFGAAANRQLGSLQQIDGTDGSGLFRAHRLSRNDDPRGS